VKASEQAIKLGKKLVSLKEECKQDIDGYVRRAVDFPSLMLSSGLVSALTFYLSKSDVDEVKKYYQYWSGGDKVHKELCNDVGKGSSKGYSAYTASLLYVLKNSGVEACGMLENSREKKDTKEEENNTKNAKDSLENAILMCLEAVEKDEIKVEKRVVDTLVRLKEISEMLSSEGESSE
jgi:CRISPR type III-B/RAMP module-associated protein Cmr5